MSLDVDLEPTKTDKTVLIYLERARQLVQKCRKELLISEDDHLDSRQFVAWLSDLKKTISRSTWRQYKSSVICYLQQFNSEQSIKAIEFLNHQDNQDCIQKTEKTSGTKLKRFPLKDFQKITEHLRQNPGKWHLPLLEWIISSCLTGLRPQEWKDATLSTLDNEITLIVKNAKNTNGRAHGETRTLILSSLSNEEIDCLRNHISRTTKWNKLNQFDDLYKGCSLCLYHLSRKIWPNRKNHLTLYSCRHQFAANAKASGFSTLEVAAMMGHRVDTTATTHYGKKAAGHELLRVRALESDIERVEARFHLKNKNQLKTLTDPQPKQNK